MSVSFKTIYIVMQSWQNFPLTNYICKYMYRKISWHICTVALYVLKPGTKKASKCLFQCSIVNVENALMSVPSQVPLLDEGIRIHGEKSTEQLKPLHNRIVTCFQDLRAKVEKLYGVITLVSNWEEIDQGFVVSGWKCFRSDEIIHTEYCLTLILKGFSKSAMTTRFNFERQ